MTVLSPAESLLGVLRTTRTLMRSYATAVDFAPSLEELKEVLGRSIDELTAATSSLKPIEIDGHAQHARHRRHPTAKA